jgi:hypothetical protein
MIEVVENAIYVIRRLDETPPNLSPKSRMMYGLI